MNTIVLPETIQFYEASRVKVGDHLILRLMVSAIEDKLPSNPPWVQIPGNAPVRGQSFLIPDNTAMRAAIIGHEPAPPASLAVGEKVRLKNHTVTVFQIIGADGDEAWLRGAAGDHYSISFSQLERAE